MNKTALQKELQAAGGNEAREAVKIYNAAAEYYGAEFEGVRDAEYWKTYFSMGMIYRMGVLEGKRQQTAAARKKAVNDK